MVQFLVAAAAALGAFGLLGGAMYLKNRRDQSRPNPHGCGHGEPGGCASCGGERRAVGQSPPVVQLLDRVEDAENGGGDCACSRGKDGG